MLAHKSYCSSIHEITVIRQEVVNLRTGMSYTRDIQLDDEGLELLARWEKDILMVCTAADNTQEFRPGAGCLGCSYTLSCSDCISAYKGDGVTEATQYAAIEATRKELGKVLKVKTKDEPIKVPGGNVGYKKSMALTPAEDARQQLTDLWTADDNEQYPLLAGLLKAEKLTKANLENVIKVLYPAPDQKIQRGVILEDMTVETSSSRFGVY